MAFPFALLALLPVLCAPVRVTVRHVSRAPAPSGLWKDAQRIVFDSGTTVTVMAPQTLDKERLYLVAKQVKVITHNRASACFCRFKTTVWKKMDDTWGDVDCACRAREGGQMEPMPAEEPLDIYGVADQTPYNQRFRYNAGSASLSARGLIFCLDAGDRKSYGGPDGPIVGGWRDVSPGNVKTSVEGRITFSSAEGFGAMRFGAHGPGDLLTATGLDIGPRSTAGLTIEAWVKLVGVPNGRGWLFNNDAWSPTQGAESKDLDRGLILHDTRFGPEPNKARPGGEAAEVDAAEWGRTAMGVGHTYQSLMQAPAVGKWLHVVGVWRQGGGSAIYRNTVRQNVDTRTYNFDGMRDAVLGGHRRLPHHHVDCWVAALRVYDRPLSAEEVTANYDFSSPRFGIASPPTPAEIKAWNPHYMD